MNLKVKLKSYTLCGSGEGRGLIDSDIVFDRHGIPFIPGRRVKGLLVNIRLTAWGRNECCQTLLPRECGISNTRVLRRCV